jgi:hypothetical protein
MFYTDEFVITQDIINQGYVLTNYNFAVGSTRVYLNGLLQDRESYGGEQTAFYREVPPNKIEFVNPSDLRVGDVLQVVYTTLEFRFTADITELTQQLHTDEYEITQDIINQGYVLTSRNYVIGSTRVFLNGILQDKESYVGEPTAFYREVPPNKVEFVNPSDLNIGDFLQVSYYWISYQVEFRLSANLDELIKYPFEKEFEIDLGKVYYDLLVDINQRGLFLNKTYVEVFDEAVMPSNIEIIGVFKDGRRFSYISDPMKLNQYKDAYTIYATLNNFIIKTTESGKFEIFYVPIVKDLPALEEFKDALVWGGRSYYYRYCAIITPSKDRKQELYALSNQAYEKFVDLLNKLEVRIFRRERSEGFVIPSVYSTLLFHNDDNITNNW